MKDVLLWSLFGLLASGSAFAAPVQAVLTGDYRPLRAAEAEPITAGFEAAWLAGLGELLGIDLQLGDSTSDATLLIGEQASGSAYYFAVPAGLTAAETDAVSWSSLSGHPFCVAAGSPHASLVAARFGGVPRVYPSAAQALIGLKLGQCKVVVDDQVLLEQIAGLPEWRRYNRLLPPLDDAAVELRVAAVDKPLQQRIDQVISSEPGKERLSEITQYWVDEVAFQAYVLADTLDCH